MIEQNLQHHRLIILGSGPAGYTAAIYAARAGITPAIIAGDNFGGQLVKTSMVDNWPGDANGVQGYALMERMQQHAERFGANIIFDHITCAKLQNCPFTLTGMAATYTCDALIIATGTSPKYLGLPSEQKYSGHGVSYCATCDGFFYKNTKVAVIGGGNTAIEDALYLSSITKEVVMIHRRDVFTADPLLIQEVMRCVQEKKIKILWNNVVEEIIGNDKTVTALKLKNVNTGQITEETVAGVFVAVGLKPNSDLFVEQLELENGYIKVNTGNNGVFTSTSIPGVFAAGDVTNLNYRQAITAAAMGCMAAMDIKKYFITPKNNM